MDTPAPDARRPLVLAATTCAIVVLASQLAGKAARDAIFLERFAVTNLPLLLAVSSALAIVVTFVFARRLRRGIPVRVVRLANVISAAMLLVEWALLDSFPRPIATIIFMHQTLLGPILVSGFWSVVSECFDPSTARRVLGTIGTGATVGAVVGAVLAERVAAVIGTNALLPTTAALELIAMWRLTHVGRGCPQPTSDETPFLREALEKITRVSLLRRLAVVTVIVTIAAALLDFVFKAVATQVVTRPDDLARLFATFHGVVGVLTAIVQWIAGRWALQELGLARTLATLPGAVIGFGVAALVAPGIGTFVALRGAENVLRNSLYREAYEVFYTPLLVEERRATKTIIDVGVERFGDVLGGVAVLAILALLPGSTTPLLVGAIALSALGMLVALSAQKSYVQALERSLLAHAIDLEKEEPRDRTTRATVEMVVHRAANGGTLAGFAPAPTAKRWSMFRKPKPEGEAERRASDSLTMQLAELSSGDARRIRKSLEATPLSAAGIALSIAMLDRPELREAITGAIRKVAPTCIGQLADALRDPALPIAIRAHLPPLLVEAATDHARAELARAGLLACLADTRYEVRVIAAHALAQLREAHPELALDESVIFESIRRELEQPVVEKQVAVDHLTTLLALALPAEPIRTAFHGLHSTDPALRGVALEYLENVLPNDIRDRMWLAFAIEVPAATKKRPLEDVLAELLQIRPHHRVTHDEEAVDPLRATQVDLPVARARR